MLEARGQIGETLQTKLKAFPSIPKSQIRQFIGRLSNGNYFSSKDEAFNTIQEYFALYLWATKLLADSYYYCDEAKAAEKAYKDAISFIGSLDFSNIQTLQNLHPNEDFSDTICFKAVPYILAEQEKSLQMAKPYDTIELILTENEIMEALANAQK